MKIVTINVPQSYLDAVQALIDLGLYNSRSEVVRVALAEFIGREEQFNQLLGEENMFSNVDPEILKSLNQA
jgi:Arc/MetJ-type ribon-helix-helix transcriptional regulator